MGLFAGFTALVVGYYVIHKPITPQVALPVVVSILRLGMAVWIAAVAGAMGRRLLPAILEEPLARLSVQAALGLGLLGLAWLGIGAAGGFHVLAAAALLAGLTAWLRRNLFAWLRDWRALVEIWGAASRYGRSLAVIVALLFGAMLLPALAPPIMYDALVYHLALPQRYIEAGRFVYLPEIMYWGMPQTGEMLYTWSMLVGGAQVAAALGWCFGLLACAGCLGLAYRYLTADAAVTSVAALLAGYSMVELLAAAYIDWLVILFGTAWFAALALFAQADDERHRRRLLALAGVFAGFALGSKYTAGVLLICGAAVILWQYRGDLRRLFPALALYGLASALAVAPWLVKNWLFTGNPAYPFLFPAGAMTSLRLSIYQGGAPFGDWRDVLFLPWRATLLGVHQGPGYSIAMGPLLVGLGACAVLAGRRLPQPARKTLAAAGAAVMAGFLVWMVVGRFSSYLMQIRLYLAFFPALALLAGAGYLGLERLALPGVRLGRIAGALTLLVMVLNLIEVGLAAQQMGAAGVIIGQKTALDYRGANLGQYVLASQALKELPPDSSALMLWETRSFDCYPMCQPDEILDRWLRERYPQPGAAPRGPEEIQSSLQSMGYTHLLVHTAGVEFVRQEGRAIYRAEDWQALEALLARLPVVQSFGAAYQLYVLPR